MGGTTPGWPIAYDDLEPYYSQAEKLYRVRGERGQTQPSRPFRPYPFPPVPGRARHR